MIKRTKDVAFATFLYCLPQAEIVSTDSEGKTLFFSFKVDMTNEAWVNLMTDYFNGKTRVDPLLYSECQKRIRDLIGMYRHNSVHVGEE